MGKLDGKVALITGGARGMGACHVRTFVGEGAKVVFGDVREDEGHALAKELGARCRFLRQDATTEQDWITMAEFAVTEFGGIDILVNNAGMLTFKSFAEMSLNEFRTVLEVNLVSAWLGIKHTSPLMRDGGSIVNISSANGLVGGANLSGYSSSKFALRGLTKSAALELKHQRIRVNSVHPAGVATPMVGKSPEDAESMETHGPLSKIAIPRYARPQEVSNMVLFLASDDSSYCTGSEYNVDGGMTAGAGF